MRRRGIVRMLFRSAANALGALAESALEISQQCEDAVAIVVVVASGSAGTMPDWRSALNS